MAFTQLQICLNVLVDVRTAILHTEKLISLLSFLIFFCISMFEPKVMQKKIYRALSPTLPKINLMRNGCHMNAVYLSSRLYT